MKTRFNIQMMDEALAFMYKLDGKSRAKVSFVIQKAKGVQDPEVFKKITSHIWEFKIKYFKSQIRLFAFWDPFEKALVVCTHGIFKNHKKHLNMRLKKLKKLKK